MILLGFVATALALGLMGGTFALARRISNFSVVDVAWSFNFTPLAVAIGWLGSGTPSRRLAVTGIVALWSLRLALLLARRIAALHPQEEGRYVELRRRWAADIDGRFLRFFLFQGVLNAVLATPLMFVAQNPAPFPSALEVTGLVVFALSLTGESVADAQLNAFKRNPRNRGGVCRQGLWAFSRHPNYFFEWLVWCAYALIASASPLGWISWFCPALMLYFLLRVTGIKATEEHAVSSRGEAYREYQATTSAFVPWFPRRAARKIVTIK